MKKLLPLILICIAFVSCDTQQATAKKQPISYGTYNSSSTFKDSIIWQLLVENTYARKAVEMCNVSSGEPIYDIAEKYATGVINDHPLATGLHHAVDTASIINDVC
jgi:hypothetical protein